MLVLDHSITKTILERAVYFQNKRYKVEIVRTIKSNAKARKLRKNLLEIWEDVKDIFHQ